MVAERMHSQVAADGLSSIGVHQTVKNAANISQVEEYCNALGGTHPIHSILIANNGMAAVKFMRSIRSWAYETFGVERAVLLVAMATPEDMRINAEHIRMADQFVEVPGGTNNNNYANVQLIVEVCQTAPLSPPSHQIIQPDSFFNVDKNEIIAIRKRYHNSSSPSIWPASFVMRT